MIFSRLKGMVSWSWTYLWIIWFILVVVLVYILRGPLRIVESVENASSYFNNLTPKFYVALTGTSSLVSGIILIFEWWYFKNNVAEAPSEDGSDNEEAIESAKILPQDRECKVWRNPMALFRGSEYKRWKTATGQEPLTYYDMNLSAQDHQGFFTSDEDGGKADMDIMQIAWRERDSSSRINAAREALNINPECAMALILLAEEASETIAEAEALLKRALKAIEVDIANAVVVNTFQVDQNRDKNERSGRKRDLNVHLYIKRRLAMCYRKQGKLKEAVKIFKDIIRDGTISGVLGVQENLIEACLEMQAYADVQALLVRYDGYVSDLREPRSAVLSYTSALLKARAVADKFVVDFTTRRGMSSAEATAIEAISRAIEFNPHIPLYLLELKPIIFPPEHYLKRGDSEALTYAFFHLQHWKRIDGALQLLQYTWKSAPELSGRFPVTGYCYPYSPQLETADREILPSWHDLSIFPKRESVTVWLFQLFACFVVACMALLAHFHPAGALDMFLALFYGFISTVGSLGDYVMLWLPEKLVAFLSSKAYPIPDPA